MRTLFILITTFVATLFSVQSTYAATLFAEDFSDGVTHWKALRDSGSMWTSHQGYVEAYVPSRSTLTELAPVFWTQNSAKSFVYNLTFTPLQGADRNISFAFQDLDNWYQVHFAQGVTELSKYVNNSRVWVHQSPYNLVNGVEYRAEIVFDAGTISLRLNDTDILSATDPSYAGETGIVTLRVSTGSIFPTKVRFSDLRVSEYPLDEEITHSGNKLAIQEITQTDPRWKDLEYDTASVWNTSANTTFGDWACNLVSQVMILQFHGITTLPDGTHLDPISYNNWLLKSSGYWQSPKTGNISRTSVSKLALLMNKLQQSPKLEFEYAPNPSISTIVNEVKQGRPAILELDGHFVVAYGFTPAEDDIFISDPAYTVELLSQHPLALKSMRSYIPSQTDLRYLEVIADPALQLELVANGQTVGVHSTEYLRRYSKDSTEYSPARKIVSIAKPEYSTYQLNITNPTSDQQSVTLVSINAESETQGSQEFVILPTSTQQFEMTYTEHSLSAQPISEVGSENEPEPDSYSWHQFRQRIIELTSAKQIKRHAITTVLLKLSTVIDKSSSTHIEHIMLQMIRITLESLPASAITDKARSELLEILDLLV